RLFVFFTGIGDAPERILLSTIDLTGDWQTWKASVRSTCSGRRCPTSARTCRSSRRPPARSRGPRNSFAIRLCSRKAVACSCSIRPAANRASPPRKSLYPPREPLEIPSHLLALLHRLAQHVAAARIDLELHGFAERLQRLVELPRARERHARIHFPVLNQERRRHAIGERQRRVLCVAGQVLPRPFEVVDHGVAAFRQVERL